VFGSLGALLLCRKSSESGDLTGQATVVSVTPVGRPSAKCGVPTRWAPIAGEFLEMHFPGRFVECDGQIPWPPHTFSITPLNFFLLRYVTDIVYKTPVTSLDELKLRIVAVVERDTPRMLENSWRETEYRLDILRAMRGTHVEVLEHSAVLIP
jgi:hypothetical protein